MTTFPVERGGGYIKISVDTDLMQVYEEIIRHVFPVNQPDIITSIRQPKQPFPLPRKGGMDAFPLFQNGLLLPSFIRLVSIPATVNPMNKVSP
jgi:hypothetical protein